MGVPYMGVDISAWIEVRARRSSRWHAALRGICDRQNLLSELGGATISLAVEVSFLVQSLQLSNKKLIECIHG